MLIQAQPEVIFLSDTEVQEALQLYIYIKTRRFVVDPLIPNEQNFPKIPHVRGILVPEGQVGTLPAILSELHQAVQTLERGHAST